MVQLFEQLRQFSGWIRSSERFRDHEKTCEQNGSEEVHGIETSVGVIYSFHAGSILHLPAHSFTITTWNPRECTR